jgi:hypothetical protein
MYKVGDVVWKASCYWGGEYDPCPVCNGDRYVTITLGDGSEQRVACSYCRVGYTPATGTVKSYKHIARPLQHTITEVRITQKESGDSCDYLAGSNILYPKSTFKTKKAAMEMCKELAEEATKKALENITQKRTSAINDAVYSVGYHKGRITKLKREVAMHEAAITLTKEEKK